MKRPNSFYTIYNFYEKNKNNIFLFPILYFCSKVFQLIYKTRIFLYKIKILKSHSLPAYVVSIGNITSGGTGKTPLTIEIAKYFIACGYKVAILSRGYKGLSNNKNEILLVSDGSDILSDYEYCGDEPYLIAKKIPKAIVIVGKDRYKTGKAALKLGAQVLVLDDGYQYLGLNRNSNILILDSYRPFDNGHLLPLGQLRELPDSISRTSAIILSNSDRKKLDDGTYSKLKRYAQNTPIFKIGYKLTELTGLNTKKTISINEAKKLTVMALCGIGNPDSFIDLLKRHELNVVTYTTYPDHFKYEYADIKIILNTAEKFNVDNIVTTEKDAIKLEELCQAAPISFWSTKLDVTFEDSKIFEKIFSKAN